MRVFLTGVACVGKTTIGLRLAELMGHCFFDLDQEIEQFFGLSIERLQQQYLMPHDFRKAAAKALSSILAKPESQQAVIALPPSGLMGGYLTVIKKTQGLKIVLLDKPEHILDRLVFYDVDSRPIDMRLSKEERPLYLREIKKDITYFKKSYMRADLQVSIEGMDVEEAAHHLLAQLKAYRPT
jgi:shikimate kinase